MELDYIIAETQVRKRNIQRPGIRVLWRLIHSFVCSMVIHLFFSPRSSWTTLMLTCPILLQRRQSINLVSLDYIPQAVTLLARRRSVTQSWASQISIKKWGEWRLICMRWWCLHKILTIHRDSIGTRIFNDNSNPTYPIHYRILRWWNATNYSM